MILCYNKPDKPKSNINHEQFVQQFERTGGLNLISASVQTTQRQLFSAVSPMPSFTPFSVSINELTAHNLINPSTIENNKAKEIEPIEY